MCGIAPAGPATPVATGSWPARFDFSPVLGEAIWVAVPASATNTEIDATLTVRANDGAHVRGSVSGTAMLPAAVVNVELALYTLTCRSAVDLAKD